MLICASIKRCSVDAVRMVVTGAAGFIGAHVCAALVSAGHDVVAIDSFSPFHPRDLKQRRFDDLVGDRLGVVHEVDVADRPRLFAVMAARPVDVVIHLAAQAGVRYSLQHPDACVATNVLGTYNVLSVASELRVSRVLYASSSSVYGATPGECREDDLSVAPTTLYGATKLAGEVVARALWHSEGLRTIGLRLFTVYGEWGRPDMAYFRMLEAALNDTTFPLMADLSVRRDFTYVDDVVQIVMALAERPDEFADPSLVVNVGGGAPCTLSTLLATVEYVTSRRVRCREVLHTAGDVASTSASSDLLGRLELPVPRTPLAEGVSRVAQWMSPIADDARRWVDATQ